MQLDVSELWIQPAPAAADPLTQDPFTLTTRELGAFGEEICARIMTLWGWQIQDRNVRFRAGELDLVVNDHGTLAFIEVKTRRTTLTGSPQAAVTPAKARTLRRLALEYLMRTPAWHHDVRIDVMGICVRRGGALELEYLQAVA